MFYIPTDPNLERFDSVSGLAEYYRQLGDEKKYKKYNKIAKKIWKLRAEVMAEKFKQNV